MTPEETLTTHLLAISTSISKDVDKISEKISAILLLAKSKKDVDDFKKVEGGCRILENNLLLHLNEKNIREELNNDFNNFLVKVIHDLLNPVNVIKGYVEIMSEEEEITQVESAYLLKKIQHILETITSIKAISKSDILLNVESLPISHFEPSGISSESLFTPDASEFILFKKNFPVLVVDDLEENCILLKRLLVNLGYENVSYVKSGEEALNIIDKFNLVLLDLEMPGLSGLEVLQKVKNKILSQNLIVLIISAADQIENIVKSINLGAQDFLSKPYNKHLLRARVGSCIEKMWFIQERNQFNQKMELEKYRYEGLLRCIFPPSIVAELSKFGFIQTKFYPDVAVLFIDLVNFTAFCQQQPLSIVIKNLQQFAEVCETVAIQNNIQKIKTIGDCFLGVGGMLSVSENPVKDAVECAHKALKLMNQNEGFSWDLHIGIHYGTVIGGIVGKRYYLFDIWGDVVNTAARIQSISSPNVITLSKEAWNQVSHLYAATSKKDFEIKGKGVVEIFEIL